MNHSQSISFEMENKKEDLIKIEDSNKVDSPVLIDGHKDDVELRVSTIASPSDDNPNSIENHSRRKLFSHGGCRSPSQTRTTRHGCLNQSLDNETYQGNNTVLQSSPATQMETFISSPSTSNISSDVDSTQSSTKLDEHRRFLHKDTGLELKEPLSLLVNSANFPPPPPPLQSIIPNTIARFQLDNRMDDRHPEMDRFFSNNLSESSYDLDASNTSSKRTNLTFSVENILAPNKFGHNGIKELGNDESKEHTDDEEEQGKSFSS